MQRKCISIFLVCMMLFSIVSPAAFAADEESVGTLEISVVTPEETITPGSEITVGISFDNNPGVYAANFNVVYDSTQMKYQGGERAGDGFKITSNPDQTGDEVAVLIQARDDEDCTETGIVANLKFTVNSDCANGEYSFRLVPIENKKVVSRYDKKVLDYTLGEANITVEGTVSHELTKVEAKEATCTEAGNKEYYTCTCGKLFADAEATTETTLEDVTIAAKGHTEEVVAGKEATCTESGLTEGKKCSVCGEVLVAQKMIAAKGHTFGDWKVIKEATETTTGERERECSVCGYKETATIPVLGHEHKFGTEWKNDATNHWHECTCGEKSDVAKHSFGSWKITKAATSTEAGEKQRECSVCNYVETDVIPAGGSSSGGGSGSGGGSSSGGSSGGGGGAYIPPTVQKTVIVLAIDSTTTTVDGKEVAVDAAPLIVDGRTYTPARFVAEQLGATVAWDEAKQLVTITGKDNTVIELTINSRIAVVNDKAINMDAAAFIKDGRTYTPSRFVAEQLGATVEWDDTTRQVTITKTK